MRVLHFIGAILVLIASPAMAKDGVAAWIVTQKSGDVRVLRNGVQPASVQVRSALSAGDVIATGANGRAMLTRGDDYVVVAPGSRLLLPKEQQQSGFTRLVQQVGTMLYKVKHTGVPHFAVDTPMLAAVVKGTTFTVVVDKDRAAVQVTEGLVEVSSLTGEARRFVEGGMTVYVGRERPSEIIDVKPGAADLPSSGRDDGETVKVESSGDVPLSTVTDLTGGLVREAPTAPAVAVATAPATNVLAVTPASDTSAVPPATDAPSTGATVDVGTPVADVATTTVPTVTDPVVAVVEPVTAVITDPIVAIIDPVVPTVVDPVVDIVETVIPTVTEPVVAVVETVVPVVTQPVVEIVETVVPIVTQPVVEVVQTTVPVVTQPVVEVVEVIAPVTQPVVQVVETVVPVVTQPIVGIVGGLLGGGKGP